jgi:uncharacterized membrane protein
MKSGLLVFLAAMTPFVELKLAIPLGLSMGLSKTTTVIFGIFGTILPTALGRAIAEPASAWMRKHSKIMDRFFAHLFEKTRDKHRERFEKYGFIFLFFFVAIPLPGSGAAMGALISFLFNADYWKTISVCTVGTVVAAGLLVTGFDSIFKLLEALAA